MNNQTNHKLFNLTANLVFIGLAVLLQRLILPALVTTAAKNSINWYLILLVVGAQLLKNLGLWLKLPDLKKLGTISGHLSYLGGMIILLLPIIHLGINVLMLTVVLRPIVNSPTFVWYQPVIIIAWLALMLADMLFTVLVYGQATGLNLTAPDKQLVWPNLTFVNTELRRIAADFLLAVYSAVGLIYTWDVLVQTTPVNFTFFDLAGAALFYSMVYAATRWISVLHFWQTDQTRLERWTASFTFLITLYLVVRTAL
ncbi:MAG: hypothetical protein GF381_01230 [Candidatus Pacebacteria bacterium]|nr:hypothetical protein [Candidatus Paceibacterota bacterium]